MNLAEVGIELKNQICERIKNTENAELLRVYGHFVLGHDNPAVIQHEQLLSERE